ncbi:hypothetical protein MVES_000787 [Malassezia vespertilionis]|uniref:Lsm14-like N-terminal domain-containing protein n=1 Tax=Malassezia vespertilionis TaxID=2020962 RepID=A0A2N1JFG7_9BASI|nr:hypothetical protein MVES_000787 [Malassezia vespertilionis]
MEPSGAGGASDDSAASFIGALISLTSRSNMRYQGILLNIDAAQATLTLEKVRSWGTEGRCAAAGNPKDELPGSDDLFDNIVFRAADVVDLRVDDPSPPGAEPTPGVPVPHTHGMHNSPSFGMQHPMHAPPPMGFHPAYANFQPQSMYGMPPDPYGMDFMQGNYMGMGMQHSHVPFGAPPPHMHAATSVKPSSVEPGIDTVHAAMASMGMTDKPPKKSTEPRTSNARVQKEAQAPLATSAVQHSQVQQRERRAVPGMPPGKTASHRDTLPEEFDFASANARFKKQVVPHDAAKNAEHGRLDAISFVEPPTEFYDKKSGFFDNISSEVKERHENVTGRGSQDTYKTRIAEENARSAETFGESAVDYRAGQEGYRAQPEWA